MTKTWTIDALLETVDSAHVYPRWLRTALDHFDGDRPELERRIVLRFHEQTEERSRLYVGLTLLHIGHPLGAAELLRGLRHSDDQQRALALDQFRLFWPDDLGYADKPGRLPVTIEEIYSAIAPLLQAPASPQGQIALSFALGRAFEIAFPDTRRLLSHADSNVRETVAHSFLQRGRDDGALDILAAQILEPAASEREQSNDWRYRRQRESGIALEACAANKHDRALAMRAGALALQVFQEALQQVPASVRFGYVVNEASFTVSSDRWWLSEDRLLDAIAAAPPPDAEQKLLTALERPDVPARLRGHVLVRYFDLTGKTPACTGHLLHALVSELGRADPSNSLLPQLHKRGLLTLEILLLAVRNPACQYDALNLIGMRPRSTEDPIIVQSLAETLAAIVRDVDANRQASWGQLKGVVTTLAQMPTTSADNERITRVLLPILTAAERDSKQLWIAPDIRGYLAMFGHAASLVSPDLPPWDAMVLQWRTDGLHATDIAAILQQAGLSQGIAADNLARLEGWIAKPAAVRSQFYEFLDVLLGLNRRVVCSRIRKSIDAPAHHELLQQLLAKSVPPVCIEAAQQELCKNHWTVSFQLQGHTRGFTAKENGSSIDVKAVMQALDDLMVSLGRTDRAFQFAEPPDWNGEFAFFIVADAPRFAEVAARLSLPLQ